MGQTAALWCIVATAAAKHETVLHNVTQSHVMWGAKHALKAFIIVLMFPYSLLLGTVHAMLKMGTK